MRIGVNLLALKPGRQGGVEHYARRLTAALARSTPHELVLLLPEAHQGALSDTAPDLRVVAYGGAYTDVAVNQAVREAGIDLLWSPWVTGTPLRAAVPSVVTVADLQHEHLPQNFTPEDRRERDRAYFMAAQLAHAVITFSRHTAEDLVRTYGVSPERVHPIPLAAGHEWESAAPDEGLLAELRHTHGTGFVLYPANTWPHKDHLLLLRALRRLGDEGQRVRLVLTGAWDDGTRTVEQAITDLRLGDQVANLGSVPPATLRALYSLAGALVFPSRFEGFGMPVLEAMGAGVPVLASDATSLPEVGGEAVLYFKAGELDELVAGLRRILTEEPLRERLVAEGRDRAREFSWEKTAAATSRVFESAFAGAPPDSPVARALNELAGRIEQWVERASRAEAEAEVRLGKMVQANVESETRLAKMLQADAEAERRLAKMLQASEEADRRAAKLEQADAEARQHLTLIREYEGLIGRIVAEVHSIRALLETARPREILGLATPWEVVRVRRVVKHTIQRLKDLVTG
jgi:glycosyltransferase involved in cell wall biosynthesis